jgi:phage gpG-like protein
MLQFTIKTRNVKALRDVLERLEGQTDLRPHRETLARAFHDAEAEQFRTEGGLTGGWRPLFGRYRAWKEAHYPGLPILVLSRRLRESLVGNTADSIFQVNAKSVRFGTKVPYAGKHQYGQGQIPPRPPIPVDALAQRMARALAEDVDAALERAPETSED